MYRLQTIIILSLLPIATLVFVGLLTLPWFQTVLGWVARIGAVYFWIVFLGLIIKNLLKSKVSVPAKITIEAREGRERKAP